MIIKASESALLLNLSTKHKAKETAYPHLTSQSTKQNNKAKLCTVVIWVNGEGLLPITTVCLV
jgi:hypothetical protein